MALLIGWTTGIALALGIEYTLDIKSGLVGFLLGLTCTIITTTISFAIFD